MENDLISRSVLLNSLKHRTRSGEGREYDPEVLIPRMVNETLAIIEELVQSAPAVDAQPVRHGRWNGEGDGYAGGEIVLDVWYCSECGHCIDEGIDDTDLLPKYCPSCGAKMDLEE